MRMPSKLWAPDTHHKRVMVFKRLSRVPNTSPELWPPGKEPKFTPHGREGLSAFVVADQ